MASLSPPRTRLMQAMLAGAIVSSVVPVGAATNAKLTAEASAKLLADQAAFWTQREKPERAAEVWKKLLAIDANNTDALSALAQFELDNNRLDAARVYTDKLKAVTGNSVAARRIETDAATRSSNKVLLEQARAAAKAGQQDEAAGLYRKIFEGKTPSGPLAVEYYQTIGGTEGGWEEGRKGLGRLAAEEPNNRRIQLAYAQQLTYRGETRREGMRLLNGLFNDPATSKAAVASLGQALTWLDAKRDDIPMYQGYLKRYGENAGVRKRLDEILHPPTQAKAPVDKEPDTSEVGRREVARNEGPAPTVEVKPVDPSIAELRTGFSLLDRGNLSAAERQFQKLLRSQPGNVDALGGLGVIRLKQDRFAEADSLLTRAAGGRLNHPKWGKALATTRFWHEMRQAESRRVAGDVSGAKQHLSRAYRLMPQNPASVIAVGDVLSQEGNYGDAETAYRHALELDAKSMAAQRGLYVALARQGKADEATQVAEHLGLDVQAKLGTVGTYKAEELRAKAAAANTAGDKFAAMQALEDAMLWEPNNAWIRLELARLYRENGASRAARSLVDGLLVSNPDQPDALYASALVNADSGEWLTVLNNLERIPEGNRTSDMTALQRRAWVNAQVQRASALARQRQIAAARDAMRQAEQVGGITPQSVSALAQGWADIGEDGRALSMLRASISQTGPVDIGVRLQYAGLLFKLKQDAELAQELRLLYSQKLTSEQRTDLDKLRYGYSMRQFDLQRESRNLAGAYDIIAPMVAERPQDVNLQLAVARLYNSANDPVQALAWYDQALRAEPRNVDALIAAGGTALGLQNVGYAEAAVNNALALSPNQPEALSLLGRVYRAQGRNQLAAQTLQRALMAEQAQLRSQQSVSYTGQASSLPYIPLPAPSRPAAVPSRDLFLRPTSEAPSQRVFGLLETTDSDAPLSEVDLQEVHTAALQRHPQSLQGQPLDLVQFALRAAPQLQYVLPEGANEAPRVPAVASTANLPPLPSPMLNGPAPIALVPAQMSPLPELQGRGNALETELTQIRSERGPSMSAGISGRIRTGDQGTSGLSELSLPLEGRLAIGESSSLTLRMVPTIVDAGGVSRGDFNIAQRFGTNALRNATDFSSYNVRQRASGVGLSLAYELGPVRVDVGTTPIGFQSANVVGGIRYSDSFDKLSLKIDVSRRAVTDSLLSYAGTTDDRTGRVWGGVTANGVRAEIGYEDDGVGTYAYGGAHNLGGRNVVSNNRGEAGVGMYVKAYREPNAEFTAGLSFSGIGYAKNLRYFTWGHGGYFSPQQYLALAAPMDWVGRRGLVSYQFSVAPSLQFFRESSALYFPGDTALQGSWEALAAAAPTPTAVSWQTGYAAQNKRGVGLRASGAVDYRFAPHWVLGGKLQLESSPNYTQTGGLVYLRYNFEETPLPVAFPPNTLKTNYE